MAVNLSLKMHFFCHEKEEKCLLFTLFYVGIGALFELEIDGFGMDFLKFLWCQRLTWEVIGSYLKLF